MNKETEGIVTILISELQDVLNDSKTDEMDKLTLIGELLGCWVKANNLHPDNVIRVKDLKERWFIKKVD